ncbi:baseplate J/gp47 family protein [Brevibacillus panacihumi]|uniref:baseplate J/gp47 family protein n=1 Tax=Brevibacillus panacihumi TaxID=497735 RepID=UPI003D089437
MAYEDQTKAAIHQRMLDATPADIDKRPGSVAYDLTGPTAIEAETLYVELDTFADKAFADTAYGEWLDRIAASVNIARRPAVKASGYVTFTGNEGTSIPKGTEVSTDGDSPIYFVTTADATITGGTATVPVEAKEAGAAGNVGPGAIRLTTGNITGITSVTNATEFEGGVDRESDDSLRKRYFERVRRPITSGNVYHYRQWALEVVGVRDVRVYPVWNGPLTVKVVVLADDGVPSQALIDATRAYIESERPVGADVTVVGAIDFGISVAATLYLAEGADLGAVQTEIVAEINEYFRELAFGDPIVRISAIQRILLDNPSVIDYANLTLNGGTGNIEITGDAIPVLRAVNFVAA